MCVSCHSFDYIDTTNMRNIRIPHWAREMMPGSAERSGLCLSGSRVSSEHGTLAATPHNAAGKANNQLKSQVTNSVTVFARYAT
jgi:hypothetical protein